MKKLITLLSALTLGVICANAQEELTVVIDDAQLMLFSEFHTPYRYKPEYSEAQMQKNWPMFHIPKGTQVQAFEYIHAGDMLHVKLNDGSIGFMHTSSFAENSDMTIDVTCKFANLPAGKYQMVGRGKMKYLNNDSPFSVAPEFLRYKSLETGKVYKVDMTTYHYAYDGDRDTMYRHEVFYSNFLNKHPGIKEYDSDDSIFYKLKDNKLPINYIGYSKSFIESILGPAWSYAGPGLKRYEGYTFACYRNVSYKLDEDNHMMNGGLVIYYDKDLRAVHIEMKDFTYPGEGMTRLRVPTRSAAVPDPDIEAKLEKAKVKGKLKYVKAEPCREVYCEPSFLDKLHLRAFCFVENDLHLTRPWHIFFALLIGIAIIGLSAHLLSRVLPFSNKGIAAFTIIANIPFTIFAIIYIWRFNFIPAVCAAVVYYAFASYFVMFAIGQINRYRCDKCRSRTNKPEIINVIRSKTVHLSEPSTILGFSNGILVNTSSSRSAGVSVHSNMWNRRTKIKLTWDLLETIKCRECGHVWEYQNCEIKEVIGPIAFYIHDKTTTTTVVNEKTTRRIYDPRTGTIYDESEKESSHEEYDTRSSTHSRNFDFDIYRKYLQRYLDGDTKALREYEDLRFGNFFPY